MDNPLGKISKEKDGYKVVFERLLSHPIETVWNAITNPEELKFWFTDIEMDFRPGGKITFRFRDKEKTASYGEIVSIEPPHKFVWTWEGELAVWELTAVGEHTTRLIFAYSKLTADYAVNAPAGFHDLLDLLVERLDGSRKISPFGAEDYGPEHYKTPVRYAEAVYHSYPELLKNPPVVVEKMLDAPIEKAWEAITDKKQMKQWYFDLDEFRLEKGFQFTFMGQGHKGVQYTHRCTITDIIPQKRLQYSWEYEGHPGYSLVTFELTEMGNKTKLRLTHHGLETFPQDNADFAWKSFNGGWSELIEKLLPEFLAKQTDK